MTGSALVEILKRWPDMEMLQMECRTKFTLSEFLAISDSCPKLIKLDLESSIQLDIGRRFSEANELVFNDLRHLHLGRCFPDRGSISEQPEAIARAILDFVSVAMPALERLDQGDVYEESEDERRLSGRINADLDPNNRFREPRAGFGFGYLDQCDV